MKKFHFSLDRVLEWRRTQGRIEEAKLEQLFGEMNGIEARQEAVISVALESHRSVTGASTATGSELAALDTFRRSSAAEHVRLESQRLGCQQRIAAQRDVVTGKRRDVRLLERLREQRLAGWKLEAEREVSASADESYLAKWKTR